MPSVNPEFSNTAPSWWGSPWSFLKFQCHAINEQHLDPKACDPQHKAKSDRNLAACIVLIACCLALQRYFGTSSIGRTLATEFFSERAVDPAFVEWFGRLYWAAFKSISYVAIPWLFLKKVWNEGFRDHGCNFHLTRSTSVLYVVMILGAMSLAGIVSSEPAFLNKYPMYSHAEMGPFDFWSWELAYGFQFLCLEFFFRGFVLFALARRFGYLAVFIAILPYSMIHYTKPALETFASMIGGTALGILSLRTRSIAGGVLAHCMIGWSMDIFALWHKGQLAQALGFP